MADKGPSRSAEESLEKKSRRESRNILKWSNGEEFTIERGAKAVEIIVQGWDLSESWKHCIDYMGTTPGVQQIGGGEGEEKRGEGEIRKGSTRDLAADAVKKQLHCYRVLWSEPTRRKPVPVATAAVYFFLNPSSNSSMEIFYTLEGQKLVHRPANSYFREVWLRSIVQRKLTVTTATPRWAPNRTITHLTTQ